MYWAPYLILSGIGGGVIYWTVLRRNLAFARVSRAEDRAALAMAESRDGDIFAGAVIRPDGSIRTWDDSHRGATRIEIPGHVFWFTPNQRFHGNGNDFWIVTHYFGFTLKDAAGTKMGDERAIFYEEAGQVGEKTHRRILFWAGR